MTTLLLTLLLSQQPKQPSHPPPVPITPMAPTLYHPRPPCDLRCQRHVYHQHFHQPSGGQHR